MIRTTITDRQYNLEIKNIVSNIKILFEKLEKLPLEKRISTINKIKTILSRYSPFRNEPVDCIIWIKNEFIEANDYNPNKVAPPEMELLEHSILQDGYTQPIVTWVSGDKREVIDGFHRNRVGKESEKVKERVYGYLPTVIIKGDRQERNDRIAATIRHNRARGKHQIESMSDIVVELKRRNWSDKKICKELGMDEDEVLRLCQVSGLTEVFADADFSEAWDAEIFTEEEFQILDEEDIEK